METFDEAFMRIVDNSTTRKSAIVWAVLSLIVVLVIHGQIQIRQGRSWVNHTIDVIKTIQNIRGSIYESQISPSNVVGRNLVVDVLHLEQLVADNQLQYKRSQVLRQQVEAWLQSDNDDLSQILDQISTIESAENSLLTERRVRLDRQGVIVNSIVIVAIAIAATMVYLVQQEARRQLVVRRTLAKRLESIEMQQDLTGHLLSCKGTREAYEILDSFLHYILPPSSGGLFEINHSRDQLTPVIAFGDFSAPDICTPRDCWALRRGEIQVHSSKFQIPCKLCHSLHGGSPLSNRMCIPLNAHENALGILHLADVPTDFRDDLSPIIQQVALPLAVLHLQDKLEHISLHDANTGVYNRRFMDEALHRAIASAKRKNFNRKPDEPPSTVSVIFLDVDHFKRFNSEHGHEVGDQVLRELARHLRQSVRQGDDLVCRYGGEEFVVIMTGIDRHLTVKKAEEFRAGIKERPVNGLIISISAGVAIYPDDGDEPSAVLKAANLALLKAKNSGRDCVVVADS
jgi:diguanylate cyclase (GGDEF)-like protein